MGLFLVSKYVLPRYFPNIPRQNNCRPPSAKIKHTSDGQPETEFEKINALTIITIKAAIAAIKEKKPKNAAITNGTSEKAIMPSNEYLNKLQNDHEVSPATRS